MNEHSIWYYAVMLMSLITLYVAYRRKDHRLLGLYLFLSGITYLFEYIVLVIFHSYEYDPDIFSHQYYDNIMGAVVSDAFSVPMTGTLIGLFQLSFFRYLPFVVLLVGTEFLFLKLQIYHHDWWHLAYTVAGLILHFQIAKYWARKLVDPSFVVRFLTLASGGILIYSSLNFFLEVSLDPFQYQPGWFANTTRDHVALATLDILIQVPVMVWLVIKRSMFRTALVLLGLFPFFDWILIKVGVLHLADHCNLFHFVFVRLIITAAILGLDRYMLLLKKNRASI